MKIALLTREPGNYSSRRLKEVATARGHRITALNSLRAEVGGILRFHVVPGQIVRSGQPVASNYSILGRHNNLLVAPIDGIILGMATHPAVKPGEPVCHIGQPSKKLSLIEKALSRSAETGTRDHVKTHLATSFNRVDPPPACAVGDTEV